MTPNQVIEHYGTQASVAEALGLSQPTISMWVSRKRVPPLQQLRLEILSDRQLKADPKILKPKVSRK